MQKWHAQYNIARGGYELMGFEERDGRRMVMRGEITVTDYEPGSYISEPTLTFTEDEAQQIMNELWNTGLRPKNGAGAVAHTESLQAHLEDLRTVAFHALKIDKR